jgi:DNA polymerase-4
MPGFCRDCLSDIPKGAARCRACGSPRVVDHPELDDLSIAHIDCDAFYATIEKRDDPSLRDKPVIVGGGQRGVVSTACYIARTFGVRSAMPMFEARRLCPNAVVIKPNMAKYVSVGRELRARMLALTPLVEPLSIDEAFLDLSGTQRLHRLSPARLLARFAKEVEHDVGISISVGLSANKFLAKIASDLDKPRGFSVLSPAQAAEFLAPKPVTFIWGIGKATGATLAKDGYRTIADLQRAEEAALMRRYGSEGQRLWRLARGIDHRHVTADREAKSISSETTFSRDLSSFRALERLLFELSQRVSTRLKAKSLSGATVTLKLKTSDFRIRTRAHTLSTPTQLAARIFGVARDLLAKEVDGTRFRLLGVGVSGLADAEAADPINLIDDGIRRVAAAEHAMDKLRQRFGDGAVVKGLVFADNDDE